MYIYWWQDRRYYSIVVSKGANPEQRMGDYASAAGLIVRIGTMESYELQKGTDASAILQAVHGALKVIDLEPVYGFKDVFALRGNLYEHAASVVRRSVAAAEREWRLEKFGPGIEARQGDRAKRSVK